MYKYLVNTVGRDVAQNILSYIDTDYQMTQQAYNKHLVLNNFKGNRKCWCCYEGGLTGPSLKTYYNLNKIRQLETFTRDEDCKWGLHSFNVIKIGGPGFKSISWDIIKFRGIDKHLNMVSNIRYTHNLKAFPSVTFTEEEEEENYPLWS